MIKIGDLARKTDCRIETIRYYEKQGLLNEGARSGGNYRLYADAHVERLRFIRHCRSLDMTLGEIRSLLGFCDAPEENCAAVMLVLDTHIQHVIDRIAELKRLETRLRGLRRQCRGPKAAKHCGILNELAEAKIADRKKRLRSESRPRPHAAKQS